MSTSLLRIIAAAPEERLGLYLETTKRFSTQFQNAEKDFCVSWVLDPLFSGS